MPPIPYAEKLDSESILRLRFAVQRFSASAALSGVYRWDHPDEATPPTTAMARAYFERLRRVFSDQTATDRLLRDFVASEPDQLKRSIAISGKLAVIPILTNDECLLSVLLSELKIDIWADPTYSFEF